MEQREKNTPATRMDAGFSSVPFSGTGWNNGTDLLLDDLRKSAVHFVYCGPTASSASSPENYHRTIIKTQGEKKPHRTEVLWGLITLLSISYRVAQSLSRWPRLPRPARADPHAFAHIAAPCLACLPAFDADSILNPPVWPLPLPWA